ncbi:DUF1800 domain-containing protein [Alsobacter sp. SYSU M60028]|uniref:DUF1800 domain-containing protein n=1 Tax=Alsobacter ponti TaxID=2962936 RepID=A0ABT1LDN0_9HYPH|nr:DUF1800 domain-containing protein [Alsobacter ponti]MCP8939615.1 DUF1800 domain-containing protein [Alsobacter ponti]
MSAVQLRDRLLDRSAWKGPGPEAWVGDLSPIAPADWSYDRAAHLLERAGFGGTPEDVARLARMTPREAVDSLVDYEAVPDDLPPFVHSGLWDPSLRDFPPSRPAATRRAETTGEAMGVKVKPAGPRRLQPVVDRFFYWLRATALETRRVGAWWANRMVATRRPLEEKMTLFWHGHFATGESKIRDYRKMLQQLELLRREATGNFGVLLEGVAKDPAMLVYLDAGQNVKGAPNENFAREVMELFTMGVGHYSEHDIREAARAFTGWIDDDLAFRVDAPRHDDGPKTFLGRTGPFDGVDILRIILEQKATADTIATKIYRFFAAEELEEGLSGRLGALLRDSGYEVKPLLRTLFLSRDFYGPRAFGTHIKSPVELVVTCYRQLGLASLPGVPDFHATCEELGQILLNPPTVAGWPQGRGWMTPGVLLSRGNFARDVLFPNLIEFVDPNYDPGDQIRQVNVKIRAGLDIGAATIEQAEGEGGMKAADAVAAAEDFNTRYASLVGWQEAVARVIPTPRDPPRLDLVAMVRGAGAATALDAVDALLARFLHRPIDARAREALAAYLTEQIGGDDLARAETYLEQPLRRVAHLVMSIPEYQLS